MRDDSHVEAHLWSRILGICLSWVFCLHPDGPKVNLKDLGLPILALLSNVPLLYSVLVVIANVNVAILVLLLFTLISVLSLVLHLLDMSVVLVAQLTLLEPKHLHSSVYEVLSLAIDIASVR